MTAGTESEWRRSAYPLQGLSGCSTPASSAAASPSLNPKQQRSSLHRVSETVRSAGVHDLHLPFQSGRYPAQARHLISPPESVASESSMRQLSRENLQAQEELTRTANSSRSSVSWSPSGSDRLARSSYTDNLWNSLHSAGHKEHDDVLVLKPSPLNEDLAQPRSYMQVPQRPVPATPSFPLSPSQDREHLRRQSEQYPASSVGKTLRRASHSHQISSSSSSAGTKVSLSLFNQIHKEPIPAKAVEDYPTQAKPLQNVPDKTAIIRIDSSKSAVKNVETKQDESSAAEPAKHSQKSNAADKSHWTRAAYPLHHAPSHTFNQPATTSLAVRETDRHTTNAPPQEIAGLEDAFAKFTASSQQYWTHNASQSSSPASPKLPTVAPKVKVLHNQAAASRDIETHKITESQPARNTDEVWTNRSYPLQSNAGVKSPQSPQFPTSNTERANKRHNAQNNKSNELPEMAALTSPNEVQLQVEKSSASSQSPRRQSYPLQSLANNPDIELRQHPAPDSIASPSTTQTPTHPEMHGKSVPQPQKQNQHKQFKVMWTRQKYPLHSSEITPPSQDNPAERISAERTPYQRSTLQKSDIGLNEASSQRASSFRTSAGEEKKNEKRILIPKNISAYSSEQSKTGGRTIIICLDGTGDKFDSDNSNIVQLVSALKKDDPRQVSYYQAGIGTYGSGGLSSGITAAMDMAVGSGLGLHVRDAYHFLMHTYKEGDKICIFGFSRGAYTARCLAGMVHKVGLLPPRNVQQIPFAYEFYKQDTPEGWKQSQEFKRTFSIDVSVYFLGCFDSVASVGFIPRQLPLSTTPLSKPRYFRHAMALDERRSKFKVCRHQTKDWDDIEEEATSTKVKLPGRSKQKHVHHDMPGDDYDDIEGEHNEVIDTDVLEVWFAGAHADVGGGAVANTERHKLAQIPLRWMIRQAFECNTGVIFRTKVLAEFGLDVHTLWPKYLPLGLPSSEPPASYLKRYEMELPERSVRRNKLVPVDEYHEDEPLYHLKSHTDEDWTPEQVEDFYDAIAPLNDQLIQAPTWWILEMWPVEYKVPVKPGKTITRFGMNMGQYRGVDDERPNLHWTVQRRMKHIGYTIAARAAAGTQWRAVV